MFSNSYTENWKAHLAFEVHISSPPKKHLASQKAEVPHIR